jgi:pimeloyl-ACP methyl ester carboxylesterase
MPTTTLNGRCLYYATHQPDSTTCPPLLLIHGAGGQYTDWPPQLRRLPGASIYTPDLPGHGRSEGPGYQTIADYADALLALLDALAIPEAIIAGHSMGGAIAQMMALSAPERVAGLALLATGARLRVSPLILDNVCSDFDSVVETIISWAYAPDASPELLRLARRMMRQIPPATAYGDYLACNGFDVMERLGEIGAPTVIISSVADRMVPLKVGRYLAEHIANAEIHLIENAGHMIAVERPDEVAQIMQGWLARHWGQ